MTAEDLQDHRGAVEHLHAGRLLQISRLRRRDVVIDEHRLDRRGGLGAGQRHQLRELAAADHGGGVERRAALDHAGHDRHTQRPPEPVQLRD